MFFYIIFTIFLFWPLFGSGVIYFQQQLLLLVTNVSAAPWLWRHSESLADLKTDIKKIDK